jgi:CRP/FNR family cyclic AMP-dependent transcriptional regulator
MTTTAGSFAASTPPASTPSTASGSMLGQQRPSARDWSEGARATPTAWLARVSCFASLSAPELEALAGVCHVRRFKPGQVLFHEGDPGHALYIIQQGQIKIVRDGPDGQGTILHVFGPGEYLGEMALVDDEPRSATAEALGDVEVLILHRDEFLALVERRPAVARAMMAGLARTVRRVTEQLQDAFLLDVPGRIARRLLSLAEQHGEVTPQGIRIPLRLTLEAWSQMVGAARPTICKELSGFRERGILSLDREGITLHRPEQLRKRIV